MTESTQTHPTKVPPQQPAPTYYPPSLPPFNEEEDEINLLEYWRITWRGKWIILLVCFVSVGLAAWYSFHMPKIYQAKTTIIPTDSGGGGLASALTAIPFAGALGAALPSTPSDKIVAILESRTIAQKVISRLDLMPVMFDKEWDSAKKTWIESDDPPTMEKAVTALQDGIVNVVADKRGMVSVTVEFKGPALSAAIANTYIMILSEYLNEHAINANFQVLDPAVTPEKKYKPSIRFNVMMSGVASLLAGILFVFTLEYIRKVREKEQKIEPDLALRL